MTKTRGRSPTDSALKTQAQRFYDAAYARGSDPLREGIVTYAVQEDGPLEARLSEELKQFIAAYNLQEKRVLDVGSGAGGLQDLVADYTGLDVAATAARFYHKPYFAASATKMPFPDNSFDVVWTIGAVEHIPEPERAYEEMRRVLKHEGLLYLFPGWQSPSWAAEGYAVRPWKDFGLRGKLIKASIPFRNNRYYRAGCKVPVRIARMVWFRLVDKRPAPLRYRELQPNYTYNWTYDSDAVNNLDPGEAILWFTSRGDRALTNPSVLSQILARDAPVILEIVKR